MVRFLRAVPHPERVRRGAERWERSAVELQGLIARREVSAVDVVTAFLERIDEVNPAVNAIVTLVAGARARRGRRRRPCARAARAAARVADRDQGSR
jgi:Asp-tRNA(Asn)/Glu-tRNA(Gln) amidotransferase A subunit family amidase